MVFLSKFGYAYIWLKTLSCYSSIPVSCGDWEGWQFEHSLSQLRVCLSGEGAKNVSWPWLSPLCGWGSLTLAFLRKFAYIWLKILSCYGSITVPQQIGRDDSLNTLCFSCSFAYQQMVLKTFPGPGYLRSKDSQSDYGISC